jgi:3-deoxy-D-manno-octulosonate 8-phosphate phosphatase (KDO 8-P phosphatase)
MGPELSKIRLLLLDVDGIMTDGRIHYTEHGDEIKSFDVKDGHGLKLLQRAGIQVGIITGRCSSIVKRRADELGIEILYQGAKDKIIPYEEILRERGFRDDEVAYMGDDLVDLPILLRVGFSATVVDAVAEVKEHVHYVASRPGGRGAVREVCEVLLKHTDGWGAVTDRYYAKLDRP